MRRVVLGMALLSGCGVEAAPDAAAEAAPAADWQAPSWEVQYRDSAALFIGLSVVDAEVVWASGSGGRVARTTDGGATWNVVRVPGADSTQFRDVHAFSAQEAFVMSIPTPESGIWHTTDGGATWTAVWRAGDPEIFMDCFSFWDSRRGFAMGDSRDGEFTLLRTEDGGATWAFVDGASIPDAHANEGAFAASGTCAVTRPGGLGWFSTGASGVDARVIRTTDFGATWTESPTPIPSTDATSGIFSLAFRDDTNGLAFGGNLSEPDSTHADVAGTEDGGLTWTMRGSTGLRGAVYGAAHVPGAPSPTWVAVSPDGSAWSADGGQTWTRIDDRNAWTVGFHDATAGWSAGQGHISRLRPGGG